MPSRTTESFFQDNLEPACLNEIKFTCYYGTFAHTPELGKLEVFHNCAVGVDAEGTIQFIKDECKEPLKQAMEFTGLSQDDVTIVDISDSERKFFFPGFIDSHIHAPQFPNNGIFGDSTLLDWLEIYTFPLESSFKDLSVAQEIYTKVIKRTLSYGTTTAAYYATIHTEASKLLGDLALSIGQRALIGKVCMNQNSPDHYIETFEECKDSQLKIIEHLESRDPKGEFVAPVITPRFAGSCTDELLKWLGELRKSKDYHCQTHLDENFAEIEWITGLFPQYKNYTDIYKQTNILGHKTILGHCIHLQDDEKDMIVESGSGIAHCPTSNSSITSGEARVRWLLDNGINVGLGTDCSGGFSPSILEIARQALLVSRHLVMKTKHDYEKLAVNEVLYLATVGGANVIKMGNLGSFKVGNKFDSQLIDLNCEDSNIDYFAFQNPQWGQFSREESLKKFQDLIDKWLFNGDDRNVRRVYINGRCVCSRL